MDNQNQNVGSTVTEKQYCTLPNLPFGMTDLEPVISRETLEYHYGKHHKGYVDKLNKQILATPLEKLPLEEVIRQSSGKIFNNAAQVWNHTFFWNCLTPKSKEPTSGEFFEKVEQTFGSMKEFQAKFSQTGEELFGSGYVWLVKSRDNKLSIVESKDARNPMTDGYVPLLTCDVWEHAYYIDYRNNRKEFLQKFWQIVNWDFVEKNFSTH